VALGTAPRRTSAGVWVTASGRRLTPAGSAYWENHHRQGRTDGRGQIRQPSSQIAVARQPPTPRLEAVLSKPKPDSPSTLAKRRAEVIAAQALKTLEPDRSL
jgi:hypothetical protein